jgi:hypothetical protein
MCERPTTINRLTVPVTRTHDLPAASAGSSGAFAGFGGEAFFGGEFAWSDVGGEPGVDWFADGDQAADVGWGVSGVKPAGLSDSMVDLDAFPAEKICTWVGGVEACRNSLQWIPSAMEHPRPCSLDLSDCGDKTFPGRRRDRCAATGELVGGRHRVARSHSESRRVDLDERPDTVRSFCHRADECLVRIGVFLKAHAVVRSVHAPRIEAVNAGDQPLKRWANLFVVDRPIRRPPLAFVVLFKTTEEGDRERSES